MNQAEPKARKHAPLMLHVALILFLVGIPVAVGYGPLRDMLSDPRFLFPVWAIALSAWAPAFLWIVVKSKKADMVFAGLYPIISVLLLMLSGSLLVAIAIGFSMILLLFGIHVEVQ